MLTPLIASIGNMPLHSKIIFCHKFNPPIKEKRRNTNKLIFLLCVCCEYELEIGASSSTSCATRIIAATQTFIIRRDFCFQLWIQKALSRTPRSIATSIRPKVSFRDACLFCVFHWETSFLAYSYSY